MDYTIKDNRIIIKDNLIILQDSNGKDRIIIGLDPPEIDLCDDNGKARITISTFDGKPQMQFHDEKGTSISMGLGIGTQNSPCLYMFDTLKQCCSLSLHNGTFSLRSDVLEPVSNNELENEEQTESYIDDKQK